MYENKETYKLIFKDYCGNIHTKIYKNIGCAISKCFKIHSHYKNGSVYRVSDNYKIL